MSSLFSSVSLTSNGCKVVAVSSPVSRLLAPSLWFLSGPEKMARGGAYYRLKDAFY